MKYTNIYNKKTLQVDFWPKQVTIGSTEFWAENRNKIRPHFRGLNSKVHFSNIVKCPYTLFSKINIINILS